MPSQSREDRDSKLSNLANIEVGIAHLPGVDAVKAVHVIAASLIVTAQGPRVGIHAAQQRGIRCSRRVASAEESDESGLAILAAACDSTCPACDVYKPTGRWVDGEEVTFGESWGLEESSVRIKLSAGDQVMLVDAGLRFECGPCGSFCYRRGLVNCCR